MDKRVRCGAISSSSSKEKRERERKVYKPSAHWPPVRWGRRNLYRVPRIGSPSSEGRAPSVVWN